MTRVIHIKNKTGSLNEVYIGRGGPFGNPFVLRKGESRGSTLAQYREYLEGRIAGDSKFKESVRKLHGMTLVCFCKPLPCHGDILAEVADRLYAETK